MCHLETGSPEAALDVKALVGLAAVEDRLVAADFLGNKIQCLDDAQTKFLALLVLGYRNILDMANDAEIVDAR